MQRGIAAVSCGAPAEDNLGNPLAASAVFTFGLVDLRNPAPTNYGPRGSAAPFWNAATYHDPSWNAENLGNVFGITLDSSGNMFVAAHGLYGQYRPVHHRHGNLGGGTSSLLAAGTVYRVDAGSGALTVFAVIPGQQGMLITPNFSSGPGLGNIAYDKANNQFFVSSLEDGKIYRLSSAGAILGSFDPLTPDNGAPGMPPRSERVWAVEVLNNAVFYSIRNDGDGANPGVIRRVTLNGSGDFIPGSDIAVMKVPPQAYVNAGGTPISDITFSLDGQTMILGARTMLSDTYSYNHSSATHMAQMIGTTWTPVRRLCTGCNVPEGEGYGGVAFGEEAGAQEAVLWSSSADMAVNYGPHGLFGVRATDFPVNAQAVNSFKVPYVPGLLNVYQDDRKGSGGDIEIMRQTARCSELSLSEVHCPESKGGPFAATLNIKNLSTNTIHYIWMTPCPTPSLPAGAITAQPQPSGTVMLPAPLPPGSSATVTLTLPSDSGGQTVCFRVTLLDKSGNQCCTDKVCVSVPPCDCAEVIGRKVTCEPQADGTIKYSIVLVIKNLTHLSANPFGIAYVSVLPPTGFSPTFATPTPNPIPPGGTGTATLYYYGTPGPICFSIGVHDDSLEECCAPKEICLDLPDCPPAPFASTRVALDPGQISEVTFDTRRIDGGTYALDFTTVDVSVDRAGTPRVQPDLTLPVRLIRRSPGGAPSLKSIRAASSPLSRIAITFSTEAGRFYRFEQVGDLGGTWTPSDCTISGGTITPSGRIRGTGGDITCYIICDPVAERVFFRMAEERQPLLVGPLAGPAQARAINIPSTVSDPAHGTRGAS